jgi:hypothetical protein
MALEGVLDDYTWLEMDPDEIVRRYMQEDVGAVQLSDVAAIQLSKETLILRLSQFVDFSAAKLDEVTGRCPCS